MVAILVGRGGIGKSKILHAFADTFDIEHQWEVPLVYGRRCAPLLRKEPTIYLPYLALSSWMTPTAVVIYRPCWP